MERKLGSLVVILLLCLANPVQASFSCRMAQMLGDEKIATNPQFWNELAKIKHNDAELEKLITKYAPELLQTEKKAFIVARQEFKIQKPAEKTLAGIKNSTIYKNYEEFLDIITDPKKGLQSLYDNPGRWAHKKLKMNRDQHTVRLNDGYRVLFEVKDGIVNVLDISMEITH